jgi:hypothetical protein
MGREPQTLGRLGEEIRERAPSGPVRGEGEVVDDPPQVGRPPAGGHVLEDPSAVGHQPDAVLGVPRHEVGEQGGRLDAHVERATSPSTGVHGGGEVEDHQELLAALLVELPDHQLLRGGPSPGDVADVVGCLVEAKVPELAAVPPASHREPRLDAGEQRDAQVS